MSLHPAHESRLGQAPGGELEHRRDDVGFRRLEVDPVQAEEGQQRQEGRPLVAVGERMVLRDPVGVGRGERREAAIPPVAPLVAGTSERNE